jgi:transposase
MTKVKNFTGIDVSKKSFDVAYRENGKVRTKKFANTAEGMASCLEFLPSGTQCVMESTGTYHLHLATFLHEREIDVSVVNPLAVKRFSQALMLRTKTDRADSLLLVEYGERITPPLWKVPEDGYVKIRQLMWLSEQLTQQEVAMSNQLEALHHSVVQDPFVMTTLEKRICQVKVDRKDAERRMEALAVALEKESFTHLTGIPGIGRKTAVVLLAVSGGMKEFESSKQLSSYFGLCPRICDSGSSVKGKARICKMGMSSIRKLLYLCSLSAIRCNRACRKLYERLLKNGKPKKLALIAVANKLLKQCFSIVKNKRPYAENYEPDNNFILNNFYGQKICP